jgi:hypothetical protein
MIMSGIALCFQLEGTIPDFDSDNASDTFSPLLVQFTTVNDVDYSLVWTYTFGHHYNILMIALSNDVLCISDSFRTGFHGVVIYPALLYT